VNGTSIGQCGAQLLAHGDEVAFGNSNAVVVLFAEEVRADDSATGAGTSGTSIGGSERGHTALRTTPLVDDGHQGGLEGESPTDYLDPTQVAEAAAHQDAPKTAYIPEGVAANAGAETKKARKLRSLLVVGAFLAVVLAIVGLVPSGAEEDQMEASPIGHVEHTELFSLSFPSPGVRSEQARRFVHYTLPEIDMLVTWRKEGCRWLDYATAFDQLQRYAAADSDIFPELQVKGVWELESCRLQDGVHLAVQRDRDFGAAYVTLVFHPKDEHDRTVGRGRLYLVGDMMVGFVGWSKQGNGEKLERILRGIDVFGLQDDGIDRSPCMEDAGNADLLTLVAEGDRWFELRDIAPENTWKAYQCLLKAYRMVLKSVQRGQVVPQGEYVWERLLVVSGHVGESFCRERARLREAQRRKDRADLEHAVRSLQEQIPERTDHRWLWAQKQLAQDVSKDRKGFGVF